jgi:signal transduction histidine kinase
VGDEQRADSLRTMLDATTSIMQQLSLDEVLRTVVKAAGDLAGAQYAALGVIGPDGDELERFVYTGITPDEAEQIGPLPRGHGLLGALIRDPVPIRLADLTTDPRSVGVPASHPPIRSFLGAPIRVRDQIYGNLYLAESRAGAFTEEDTQLLVALAGIAGIAVENARLFELAARRQRWLQASTELTQRLLAAGVDPMRAVGERILRLADARLVTVVVPDADSAALRVAAAVGRDAETYAGMLFPREGSLSGLVMAARAPAKLDGPADADRLGVQLFTAPAKRPVMALPLIGTDTVIGTLIVSRAKRQGRFTDTDVELGSTFAAYAAVAVELARAREDRHRIGLLEDRDRIAEDLHDHVIQRLFATGLTVQSMIGALPEKLRGKANLVVDDLDETIRQIRSTIFDLHDGSTESPTLRSRVLTVVEEMSGVLPPLELRFTGAVDLAADESLVDDVEAVTREALSNVAKHAKAGRATVAVFVGDGILEVMISDDGVGLADTTRRSGLANLRRRAVGRGGSFDVGPNQGGTGTRVDWTTPI